MNHHFYTRRSFLQKGLTILSSAATVPHFLNRSAFGLTDPFDILQTSSQPGVPDDRILVVVQLAGGNDGLNTVVPYGADDYYKARPNINIPDNQVLRITENDGLGFHPNLTGLKQLHDDGLLTTIQGVGYPNPNRSHFTSMDIWHTADPKRPNTTGWIGRYFDNTCEGSPLPNAGVSIGQEAPHAMMGDLNKPVSFESEDRFRWNGQDINDSIDETYRMLNGSSSAGSKTNHKTVDDDQNSHEQLKFLTRTALDAQIAGDQIRRAVQQSPLAQYPANDLANQLRLVALMIRAKLPTQVYYVSLGGFDTHAGQMNSHANLMTAFGSSVLAFYEDLKQQGNDEQVLTMTFSEFGRRVGQNASAGTDHGTAAPMWLIGPMVQPGVIGTHPSLTRLDQGDLIYNTDFRSVYATILDQWFKTDSAQILNQRFNNISVFHNGI